MGLITSQTSFDEIDALEARLREAEAALEVFRALAQAWDGFIWADAGTRAELRAIDICHEARAAVEPYLRGDDV